jgi:hypothetical protein
VIPGKLHHWNVDLHYWNGSCPAANAVAGAAAPSFSISSQDISMRIHAVWEPATAAGQLPCSGVSMHAARWQKFLAGKLVIWTIHACNGRQAVMSALEALVLAGKGLNAFSVLFIDDLPSKLPQLFYFS